MIITVEKSATDQTDETDFIRLFKSWIEIVTTAIWQ